MPDHHSLLSRYQPISDQLDPGELTIILHCLASSLQRHPEGAVVELGCYVGTASLFIARLLKERGYRGQYHVYDSFEGLPSKTAADASPAGGQFRPGELRASQRAYVATMKAAGVPLPVIHKGWFEQLVPADIPEGVGFALLDGDYFSSIAASLCLIESRLLPGAVIVVDDYTNEALPGARRAVDAWLRQAPPHRLRVECSLAVITLY